MNIWENYGKILEKFVVNKFTNLTIKEYNEQSYTEIFITHNNIDKLFLYTNRFPKWQELKYKYTDQQLIKYFLEIIRKELPELKGIKLKFKDIDNLLKDKKIDVEEII